MPGYVAGTVGALEEMMAKKITVEEWMALPAEHAAKAAPPRKRTVAEWDRAFGVKTKKKKRKKAT